MGKTFHIYADGTSDMTKADIEVLRNDLMKNPIIKVQSVEIGESQTKHVSEFLNEDCWNEKT